MVFTTHEKADLATSSVVMKDPAKLEPLNRDKLFVSVYESCRHRPSALADAGALTDTILGQILKTQSDTGVITLHNLTDITLQILQNFDSVAATYYRAYFVQN